MLVQDTAEKAEETAMPGRVSRDASGADGQQTDNGQTGWQREAEDRQVSSDITRIKTKLTEIDEVKSQVDNLRSLEKEIRRAESDIERLGLMSSFEGQGESDQEILGGGARAADSAKSWPGEDRPPFFIAPYTLTRSSGAETEVVLCAINPTWTHDGTPMTLVYGKQGGIKEGRYDTSGLLAEVTVVPLCPEAEAKGKTLIARASQESGEFSLFLVDSFPPPEGSNLAWENEDHTDVIIAKFTDIIETIQIGGIVTSTGGTAGDRTVASFSVRSRTVQNDETGEATTVWEVFAPTWVTEAAEYRLSEGWYSLEQPFDGAKLYAILEMTIANNTDRTVTVNGLIVTLHEEEYQNTDPVDPGQSTEGSVGKRYYKVMIGSFSSSSEGGPVSFTQYHIGCIVERPIINEQGEAQIISRDQWAISVDNNGVVKCWNPMVYEQHTKDKSTDVEVVGSSLIEDRYIPAREGPGNWAFVGTFDQPVGTTMYVTAAWGSEYNGSTDRFQYISFGLTTDDVRQTTYAKEGKFLRAIIGSVTLESDENGVKTFAVTNYIIGNTLHVMFSIMGDQSVPYIGILDTYEKLPVGYDIPYEPARGLGLIIPFTRTMSCGEYVVASEEYVGAGPNGIYRIAQYFELITHRQIHEMGRV